MDAGACERWADALLAAAGDAQVVAQTQAEETSLSETTLEGFIRNEQMDSSHEAAALVFDEGLLDDHEPLARELREVRESVFDDADWFDSFPEAARPRDCLVLAGEGARSTLHRDPFEWTGTSLVLEGSKVWRFVVPTPNVDEVLGAYRLDSVAWGDQPLSRGWQSDASLFATRAGVPSARSLAEHPERLATLDSLAADDTALEPSMPGLKFESVVQNEGDLMVIPKGWYHQTYALEPSLAVASQRCGSSDARAVIDHILHTTQHDMLLDLEEGATTVVRSLFDRLASGPKS